MKRYPKLILKISILVNSAIFYCISINAGSLMNSKLYLIVGVGLNLKKQLS